jgi:hypothetical protein
MKLRHPYAVMRGLLMTFGLLLAMFTFPEAAHGQRSTRIETANPFVPLTGEFASDAELLPPRRSDPDIAAGAVLGFFVGAGAGGLIGYWSQGRSPGNESRLVGGVFGALIGGTFGAPTGAHLTNDRKGDVALNLVVTGAASTALLLLGTGATGTPFLPLLAAPVVLVGTATLIERASSR